MPKALQATRKSVRKPTSAKALAASICRGFTESGDKTRKSRRSGKSISHSKIGDRAHDDERGQNEEILIVHGEPWGGGVTILQEEGGAHTRDHHNGDGAHDGGRRIAIDLNGVVVEEAAEEMVDQGAGDAGARLSMAHLHHVHHVAGYLFGVGLLDELGEDAFERGQRHELGEVAGCRVGDDLAAGETMTRSQTRSTVSSTWEM